MCLNPTFYLIETQQTVHHYEGNNVQEKRVQEYSLLLQFLWNCIMVVVREYKVRGTSDDEICENTSNKSVVHIIISFTVSLYSTQNIMPGKLQKKLNNFTTFKENCFGCQ